MKTLSETRESISYIHENKSVWLVEVDECSKLPLVNQASLLIYVRLMEVDGLRETTDWLRTHKFATSGGSGPRAQVVKQVTRVIVL